MYMCTGRCIHIYVWFIHECICIGIDIFVVLCTYLQAYIDVWIFHLLIFCFIIVIIINCFVWLF